MKGTGGRWVLVGLIVLLATPSRADGVFLPLNGGEPVEPGPVAAAVAMRNAENELFLLYLRDEALVARKSDEDGANFTPVLPQFGSHDLTNFRQLTLLSRVWEPPVAFFVADEGGVAGLYSLCFTPEGHLSLLANGRLDDLSPGEIAGYTVMPEAQDRLFIAYLKSGTLKYSCVSTGTGVAVITHADVSNPAEEVSSYGIFECFPPNGISFTGYYLTAENGMKAALHSFTVVDDQVVERAVLDTAAVSGSQQVHFYVTIEGRFEVAWLNGRGISMYTYNEGRWQRGGVVTAPLESFAYFAVTDGRSYVPALATYPGGDIYFDLDDLLVMQNPVNLHPILKAPGAFPSYKGNKFFLAYLEENGGRRNIQIRLYDFAGERWQDLSFPTVEEAEILDAWFSGTYGGLFAAVLAEQADGRHLLVYQLSPATLAFERAVDVPLSGAPGGSPAADTVSGESLHEDGLLVLTTGSVQVVVDVPARKAEFVAKSASFSTVTSHLADGGPRMYLVRTDRGTLLAARRN